MKYKIVNPISVIALAIFILTSISFAQTNDDPNKKMKDYKHMDHKSMPDSCKMMMDKETMPDSCKMMMNNPEHMKMMKDHMMMDSNQTMMKDPEHKMMMKNMKDKMIMKDKNSVVREGVIDLASIDENNDGKVFQDQMDWNVISDKPGSCPLCGMKLQEVTLEKVKENLLKNGFKVK